MVHLMPRVCHRRHPQLSSEQASTPLTKLCANISSAPFRRLNRERSAPNFLDSSRKGQSPPRHGVRQVCADWLPGFQPVCGWRREWTAQEDDVVGIGIVKLDSSIYGCG
ncbi:hypothetical protein BU26DRAFT_94344 [Trematosphaeria pertusa]|uniref:Uncharacterized protein n=1 Tax=Trematosphaeria pertusa TaxID=390896 RepID=A0A6A6I0Y9_9PLEO|nr:uncharacterized protein BU26DRAFT_94344 [Trematosphaeria pertusa]KAF2244115.1 hypothetical protein BU26DRAFT_94344 [Trematosphaeria pertusa]